jgi:hypothetical protein
MITASQNKKSARSAEDNVGTDCGVQFCKSQKERAVMTRKGQIEALILEFQ